MAGPSIPALPRAAQASSLSGLGQIVDRCNDAMLAQVRPLISRYNATPQWVFIGTTGAPPFLNSWTNFGGKYNPARFWKDGSGVVHLSGLLAGGTVGTSITATAFVLPAGYRPLGPLIVGATSNAAYAEIRIGDRDSAKNGLAGGAVTLEVGSNASFSLECISFPAEQ